MPSLKAPIKWHVFALCACIASLALAGVFSHALRTSTSHLMRATGLPSTKGCNYVNALYVPSSLEQQWHDNSHAWADAFCDRLALFEKDVDVWLQGVSLQAQNHAATAMDAAIFSSFQHTYDCEGINVTYTTYIEPLSHGLRHPRALCGVNASTPDDSQLFNTSYIVYATTSDADLGARGQRCLGRACQKMLISVGGGDSDDNSFQETYRQRGIEFDRILQWRADIPSSDGQHREQRPYQHFDLNGVADPANRFSPLRLIKEITQPGDFVAFKLDIDDYGIEHAIVKDMLNDEAVLRLVDEFLYEDHVQFAPMLQYWGGSAHPHRTLSDSYDLFSQIRRKGIRAHSWV